jgi:hypothetical protein
MPRFLDVHSMKGLDEDSLKEIQHGPTDEFDHTISRSSNSKTGFIAYMNSFCIPLCSGKMWSSK